ncbi:NB-ARC domain-containing protein [Micromonospora echinofusca]|uniref:NB-ARC domain-containing protein n=1 Tax=Micromonospora echinofusca TaxID=47858 RepID=A0ABS3VYQ4_MICEH|nr:NB-ARC domain-containing protein [Micromonospora echinofusca]MBO4209667.1 hypothetical protein [Micromonospora echinofusca]
MTEPAPRQRDQPTSTFTARGQAAQYNAPGGSLTVNYNVGGPATPRPGVPWMLPALNRRPVDRPELTRRMLELLGEGTGRTVGVTTALHGAGGFGKTTLASYVCSRPDLRKVYPGGLLWVTVGQDRRGADLASAVNDLCVHISGDRPALSDAEQAGYHLGALLDQREPTLLVVDDVWDEIQLRPFLMGGARCTRVITTRIPTVIPDHAHFVHVDQMEQQESVAVLTSRLPSFPTDSRRTLLELTGRWPLLLALVNAALRRAVRNGSDLRTACLHLVDRLSGRGPTALDVRIVDSRARAVDATMKASMSLLGDADRERYRELAIFAEDVDLPFDVVATLWHATGGYDANDTARVIDDLVDLSLVAAYQIAQRSLRLHDVLRQYLRHLRAPPELARTNATFLDASRTALAIGPGDDGGAPPWWSMPDRHDYLWQHLPYHLAESGRTGELDALLTDLRWLAEKSRRYDVAAVEADLTRSTAPVVASLKAALAREAHVLQPITPETSYPDVIVSRLTATEPLGDLVTRFRTHTWSADRIENHWPLPDQSAALVRVFRSPETKITRCALSRDREYVATVGFGRAVTVWNAGTGQRLFQLDGHADEVTDCAFSPDGLTLFSVGADQSVRVWDLLSRKLRTTATGHTGRVNACAVSTDGTVLLTAGNDRTARLWDAESGRPRLTFDRHTAPVLSCALSPDAGWAVTTSADGQVRQWDTRTGEQTGMISAHAGRATTCAVATDGSWFATGGDDGIVRLWDGQSRRLVTELVGHQGSVTCVSVSHAGTLVASCGDDQTVRLWDARQHTTRAILHGHSWYVTDCCFSSDDQWLVSSGWDHTARIWHADGQTVDVVEPAARSRTSTCAAAPGSGRFVTGGRKGDVRMWSVRDRTHTSLGRPGATISSVHLSASGALVAAACLDGVISVWDLSTGTERRVLGTTGSRVERCRFSPDDRQIATAMQDGTVRIWSWPDGKLEHVLSAHQNWVADCAYSPDGELLVTASWDQTARVWNRRTGETVQYLTDHHAPVYCCTITPSGEHLVTGGDDGMVRVWTLPYGLVTRALPGHGAAVRACAVSPDGRFLLTGGDDASVRVWTWGTFTNVASMRISSPVTDLCWCDSDGTFCVVGDAGVHLFRFCGGSQPGSGPAGGD